MSLAWSLWYYASIMDSGRREDKKIKTNLDLREVGVGGVWVEGEGDEGVDGNGLGDELEGPSLLRETAC